MRLPAQSAAVDAAILHLLAGHRWTLSGDLGRRRIQQSEESALVRSLARTMIDDSQRRTGPYRIQVRQKGTAVIGDPVRLAIRVVVARNGRPLPFVPVRVQTPDGILKGDLTRADGRIGLTYPMPSAGVTSIRVAGVEGARDPAAVDEPSSAGGLARGDRGEEAAAGDERPHLREGTTQGRGDDR